MSVRSLIAMETADGIKAIYCHNESEPEHHLPILTQYYTTDDAVAKLLKLGDLSVLGPELGRKHDFRSHRDTPKANNWCLAYGRDRGEPRAKRRFASEKAFLDGASAAWSYYLYLFRGGRWLYRDARKGETWLEAKAWTETRPGP